MKHQKNVREETYSTHRSKKAVNVSGITTDYTLCVITSTRVVLPLLLPSSTTVPVRG